MPKIAYQEQAERDRLMKLAVHWETVSAFVDRQNDEVSS